MSITPTFLYNAQGTAFGGVMRRPFNEVLEAKAATSLPQTGGVGSAVEPEYDYKGIFSFKKASTRVSGSKGPDGSYNTLVTTIIEGLNINNVVTCARIVARLTTVHDGKEDETRVIPSGSEFVDLRIDGHPVKTDLDLQTFCDLNTIKVFRERYAKDKEFRKTMSDRFGWAGLNWPNPDTLPEPKGIVSCSLVKNLSCDCPELTIKGNSIKVPDFGTIYLAEYYAKENTRTLNMMRFALGSPVEGDVTAGGIQGNGTGFP